MTQDECQEFSSSGSFTIRRSAKLWAGVWSDMTIEQVLMRAMKSSGFLTHDRGLIDSALTFRNVAELNLRRQNNMCICASDVSKLTEWFTLHHPLSRSHELMSISTGVIGNDTINCDASVAIGTSSMNKLVGKTFASE